jgi:hypothetical protein
MRQRSSHHRQFSRCSIAPVSTAVADPFAVDPIRRSFGLVVVCAATIFLPWLAGPSAGETAMITVGWIALTGLILGIPVLLWSLAEEGVRIVRRRLQPGIDQLGLSPRVAHILERFGYESILSVERASDGDLMLLSNMDARGLQEVRRAVTLWNYRRWQERGFPVRGFR